MGGNCPVIAGFQVNILGFIAKFGIYTDGFHECEGSGMKISWSEMADFQRFL
jgi:hypothetical protein